MSPEERGSGRVRPGGRRTDRGTHSCDGRGRASRAGPTPAPPAFVPLETKLRAPIAARRLVRRRRLLEALAADPAPLVVFSAPAGCGKTTAVRQWLEDDPRPWAWVQLDEGDNDPVTLLHYLARALRGLTPLDPAVLAWLELPEPPVREAILPALVKAASSAPSFVLVLDDTQALQEEGCWHVIAALLAGLSPGSSLVCCGRSDPHLPLGRLRSLEQVAEYRYEELVFDAGEMSRLLAGHGVTADDALLSTLAKATEGWPAGVYLTILSWRSRGEGGRSLPPGSRRELAEYLNAEVLAGLRPDLVEFLTRTSIVRNLSPELCDLLTGRNDSGKVLAAIQHDNLFLISLNEGGDQYRYHHLFEELLQAELGRREAHLLADLHRRAAGWFEREDRVREALRHFLAASEVSRAADLVVRRWWSRYLTGRVWTARRWLDLFSAGQLEDDPGLRVAAAWILAMTGEADRARRLMCGFDPSTLDGLDPPDRAASPRSSAALVRALLAAGGAHQMRDDAREAARLEGMNPGPWQALCRLALGVAEMLCGDDSAAGEALELAARRTEAWDDAVDLAALGELSLLAGDAGRWDEAAEYAFEAARRADAHPAGDYLTTAAARLARDRLAARDGDDDAVADLEDLLEQSTWDFCPWVGVRAGLLLAEARLARGERGEARRRLGQARQILARWSPAPGLVARAEALDRSLRLQSQVEPLSRAELRVLGFMPTSLTTREIAVRLGVSPNTVGSHVKALHRKLGATRRSEVVARAAALGLLAPAETAVAARSRPA